MTQVTTELLLGTPAPHDNGWSRGSDYGRERRVAGVTGADGRVGFPWMTDRVPMTLGTTITGTMRRTVREALIDPPQVLYPLHS